MQINGFDTEQTSAIHECERNLHQVIKSQLSKTIQDLISIQRNRANPWQTQYVKERTLPGETVAYEYVTQKE